MFVNFDIFMILSGTFNTLLADNEFIKHGDRTMRKLFSAFVLFVLLFSGMPVFAQTYEAQRTQQVQNALKTSDGLAIRNAVNKYSAEYKVDPYLVHAIILTESGYNKNARSHCGAAGLMQLMPATFKARNVGTNPYSIDQNVKAGTKHISGLLAAYGGSVPHALAAYNAGGANVKKGKPVPSYTRHYVNRVMHHRNIIKESVAI